MRTLQYSVDLDLFKEIKKDIVPVLFTEHQFELIKKRFSNKKMTDSEKNEFSRTISKKMKAINKILQKETGNMFVYGGEKIRKERLNSALKELKRFSRKFKNKHIIITGSFLYRKKYNDIDIFVISRYEKEDYKLGRFHINYLTEDVYNSLFFQSVSKLCVSNRRLVQFPLEEKVSADTFISLYQELFSDLDNKFKGIKNTLRDFLLQAAFIRKSPIPDSFDLYQEVDSILKLKRPKEIIKNIFINTIVVGVNRKKAINIMKDMVKSYKDVMKEYKQHRGYYTELMQAFRDVISIEG